MSSKSLRRNPIARGGAVRSESNVRSRSRFLGSPFRRTSVVALLVTGALVAPLVWLKLPPILAWLLPINVVTFSAYALDKRAARRQAFRTPEATLHLLAFVGGIPAALFAQQALRHKTQDRAFQWVTTGVVVLQTLLGALFFMRFLR
jgi:uncharacterized membrane protein YsdA (DUF1294 family)